MSRTPSQAEPFAVPVGQGAGAVDAGVGSVRGAIARFDRGQPLVAAFSGGAHSLALLHALASARSPVRKGLRALHVDHAIHPDSPRWARQAAEVCGRLGVPVDVERVEVRDDGRMGPEGAAREARWTAFARALRPGETLCTAHHADDQVETVLIALARGAGPAGLAGMPASAELGEGRIARPLLGLPAATLEAYARETGLGWIDDPANADPGLARGRLRRDVTPALRAHWPGVTRSIARAAAHQARVAHLLDALAGIDLVALAGDRKGTLSCAACAVLDADRLRNALRRWLRERALPPPASRHLECIMEDVICCRPDAEPLVHWPGAEVRRHGDALCAMTPLGPPPAGAVLWDGAAPLEFAHGRLALSPARGEGLQAGLLAGGGLEVRFRIGGERCRPAGRAHSQTLRRLFQQHRVAPWDRDRTPLLYVDGVLVAVAGLWVCEGYDAAGTGAGLVPDWTPSDDQR